MYIDRIRVTLLFLFFIAVSGLRAQDIQVSLGPDAIGENQGWTITVTVHNDRLRSYDNFPDIEGFRKRGTSTQSTQNIVNGQISSSQSVIMTYLPTRQGTFQIPDFTMKVNDQAIHVQGKTVTVGAPVQRRDPFRGFFDSHDDFFGREETEFIDVKDDAFLALTTSKDEVYTGEGFNTILAFYVSEENRAPLQFHDLGRQLSEILKKLKPNNCWEENFNIENIEGERIELGGKNYTRYKIYQATYYPLNSETITFPSVSLEMIKYKVARNPTFFGQNRLEGYKTFHSKPRTVRVKPLPPHPLRDVVAVGEYKLTEAMPTTDLTTGRSVAYGFSIFGEGNISAIQKPDVTNNAAFEFYEPNIRMDVRRNNGRVSGTKTFNYFLIPREPGRYDLGNYFRWIFFNPETGKYDTLRSKLNVYVTGESTRNAAIEANDDGSFYDRIGTADNTLVVAGESSWQGVVFGIFILVALASSAYLVFKK